MLLGVHGQEALLLIVLLGGRVCEAGIDTSSTQPRRDMLTIKLYVLLIRCKRIYNF
jgi:hypothetical protein